MPPGRSARVWNLVAAQAARHGRAVSAADVCAAALTAVAVTGAGLTAATRAGSGHVMCATDGISEQIAELELTLGEGPAPDAVAAGGPVLASDLAAADVEIRWPSFAAAARQAGASAIFAFPLQIGAIRVGVLEMYRSQAGPLDAGQLGDALVLADTAAVLLLEGRVWAGGAEPVGTSAGQPPYLALHRAEIDQATGMLTEQLQVGIEEAFVRLRAYAYAQERRLIDVAGDIVARRLRLEADPDMPGGGAR
jgi:ANTAR domain-containing protein